MRTANLRSAAHGGILVLALFVGHWTMVRGDPDQVFGVPAGVHPDPFLATSTPSRTAVALFQDDAYAGTTVMQIDHDSGVSVLTALPGMVNQLSYSPTGSRLLAHHRMGEQPDDPVMVSLVDDTGSVVWSREDARRFRFSNKGQRICAVKSDPENLAKLEIFDLSGATVTSISLDNDLFDAVVDDQAKRAVLAVHHTITAFDWFPHLELVWTFDLSQDDPPVEGLELLGSDRILVRLAAGRFKVIDWDGAMLYGYDPPLLAGMDPERSVEQYERYRPYYAPEEDAIYLYNGTSDALALSLDDYSVSELPVNTDGVGFKTSRHIFGNRLVLVKDDEIRVRQVGLAGAEVPD